MTETYHVIALLRNYRVKFNTTYRLSVLLEAILSPFIGFISTQDVRNQCLKYVRVRMTTRNNYVAGLTAISCHLVSASLLY